MWSQVVQDGLNKSGMKYLHHLRNPEYSMAKISDKDEASDQKHKIECQIAEIQAENNLKAIKEQIDIPGDDTSNLKRINM